MNSLVEDTSVLVAASFLLVRNRIGSVAIQKTWLGAILGVISLSEVLSPNSRYPYTVHALAIWAAAFCGGVEAVSAAGVLFLVLLLVAELTGFSHSSGLFAIQALMFAGVGILACTLNWFRRSPALVAAGLMIALQSVALLLSRVMPGPHGPALSDLLTVPANAVGTLLISLVFVDANLREQAESLRTEAVEARRLAAEAESSALRSRVRPHFLFNSLNTIAALADIAPSRASSAAVRLGQLLRRSMQLDTSKAIPLSEEVAALEDYVGIEKERFGDRLQLEMNLDPTLTPLVPAFAIQILVENAILHGITAAKGGGHVTLTSRSVREGCLVCVCDDGVGLPNPRPTPDPMHGLGILDAQLRLLHGPRGRLRLFRRRKRGTLAAFLIPNDPANRSKKKK